jgi:hypothetical protein
MAGYGVDLAAATEHRNAVDPQPPLRRVIVKDRHHSERRTPRTHPATIRQIAPVRTRGRTSSGRRRS